MVKLELLFATKPIVQLIETRFNYPSHRVLSRKATRGQYEGSFPWAQGTRSLCMFLLRWASWAMPGGGDGEAALPLFEGRRPSPASTLNDLLSARRASWLYAVFGGKIGGDPLLVKLARVKNRDFKTAPGAPVSIELDTSALSPSSIMVYRDDVLLVDAADVATLYADIERQYWKSAGVKPPQPHREAPTESADFAPEDAGVAPGSKSTRVAKTATDYIDELKALTTPGHYRDYVQASQSSVCKMLRDPSFQQVTEDGSLAGSMEEYAEGFLRYLGQSAISGTEIVTGWFADLEHDPWWIMLSLDLKSERQRSPGKLLLDMAHLAMTKGDLLSLCGLLHSACITHQVAVARDSFLARLHRLPQEIGMEVFTRWTELLGGKVELLQVIKHPVPAFKALQAKDVRWFDFFQFMQRDSITPD